MRFVADISSFFFFFLFLNFMACQSEKEVFLLVRCFADGDTAEDLFDHAMNTILRSVIFCPCLLRNRHCKETCKAVYVLKLSVLFDFIILSLHIMFGKSRLQTHLVFISIKSSLILLRVCVARALRLLGGRLNPLSVSPSSQYNMVTSVQNTGRKNPFIFSMVGI